MVDVVNESAAVSDMLTDEDTVMEDCPENSSDNGHSSDTDGETDESNDENGEGLNGNSTNEEHVDLFKIESVVDLEQIDFRNLTATEVQLYHFSTRQVAFEFYRKYAEKNGFAARKWNIVRNKKGDVTQQTYVCFKEGFRLKKHLKRKNRKREARPMTRCGCKAFFRVRIDVDTGRWHVKAFSDEHSHELLAEKFVGMLPAHRKMHDCDINQMNSMRDAGIGVSQIYGLAANQCGGYDRLAFRKQDMYNEIVRQRRKKVSDVRAAFAYLRHLRSSDSNMFWSHTTDAEGRLEHLFWVDGRSQADYMVFGDVVAFDATYRRNKYMSPLVVFAGVNHHNQTIVFGSGLVANETEETYVWLLKQFVEAMKGKFPSSVITDGDLAMRNAIKTVFPDAHHRLCAWHLLRNATSNVSNPRFTTKFRRCMLGDYDVGRFRAKWEDLITEFDLQGNEWARELYEKRKMWATAHIRGNFFAGFRTTSRCEGMHSQVGRYVHYRNNLTEFLKHFSRYLAYTRQRELEADFESIVGEPVLVSQFEDIERCGANIYTRKIFHMFRLVLEKASSVKVVSCEQTPNCLIYIVCRRSFPNHQWYVSLVLPVLDLKCSCLRMESLGIPCEHIICLLNYLEIRELPDSLIVRRWTKNAKHPFDGNGVVGAGRSGSVWRSQVMGLLFDCYEVCKLAGRSVPNLDLSKQYVKELLNKLRESAQQTNMEQANQSDDDDVSVRDPAHVRTKGCGNRNNAGCSGRGNRRTTCCSICQAPGHNKKTCPLRRVNDAGGTSTNHENV